MYKIIRPLTLAVMLFFVSLSPLQASWLPWSSSTLATINGKEYTSVISVIGGKTGGKRV